MRKLLLILLLIPFFAAAQTWQQNNLEYGHQFKGLKALRALLFPLAETTVGQGRDTGAVYYRLADSSIYVYTGSQWRQVAGGAGAVTSVFGRTGAVTALEADYNAFYPLLSGTYNNPSWLNQLAWSKITGTPTTLAGYGITDGLTNITGLVTAGTNITITGSGTSGSPYVVNSSGGGSADSSWVSTETGTQYNTLGTIINTDFPGSSLPTGWVDVSPQATVTVSSNRIAVSGGNNNYSALGGTTGAQFDNRIEIDYYNYDKETIRMTIVPQDKASASNIGFHFTPNSQVFTTPPFIHFNLSDNADSSGMVTMWSYLDRSSALAKSNKLSWSAFDTLDILIQRDGSQLKLYFGNRETGDVVDLNYSTNSLFGTGGKLYLALLGGSQHIANFSVESHNRNNYGFTFIGESDLTGAGASSEFKSFVNLSFRGDKTKYSNISSGSVVINYEYSPGNFIGLVQSHLPNLLALNNPYAVIISGRNDRRDLITDTNAYRIRLDSLIQPIIRAGITPILTTLIPQENTATNETFNTCIKNLATTYGLRIVKLDSILRVSASDFSIRKNYSSDGVHLSDTGHIVVANELLRMIPEINTYFNDSSSFVQFHDLPNGNDGMNTLAINTKGELFKVPQYKFNGIENSYQRNAAGTNAQANSELHVSGPVKTDSVVIINNASGLRLGFNANGLATRRNIEFTNVGATGGYTSPQGWSTFDINSTRNFVVQMSSVPANGAYTFTNSSDNVIFGTAGTATALNGANNNLALNVGAGFSLTTGDLNIGLGKDALRGITTGNSNFHAIIYNPGAASFPNVTNTVIIGDMEGEGQDPTQSGDISISNGFVGRDQNFWFGMRGATNPIYFNAAAIFSGTNVNGNIWYQRASRGRGTGVGGLIKFQSWNAGTTGTTLNSSASDELDIENKKIVVYNRFQTSTGANVASANDLTLGNDGNVFHITGTTQINAITTTNWQAGSEIILIFDASVTVKNNTAGGGGTAVMLLAGAADFSATANDVLRLVFDGVSFYEVSRSVN